MTQADIQTIRLTNGKTANGELKRISPRFYIYI